MRRLMGGIMWPGLEESRRLWKKKLSLSEMSWKLSRVNNYPVHEVKRESSSTNQRWREPSHLFMVCTSSLEKCITHLSQNIGPHSDRLTGPDHPALTTCNISFFYQPSLWGQINVRYVTIKRCYVLDKEEVWR